MNKIKVFVSHKHEFRDSAKRLKWYLNRLAPDRFDFFASSTDIAFGDDWRNRVKVELAKADWLIALTTQCEGKSKEWIVSEISSFCEINQAALGDHSGGTKEKRCIIIHDEGDRLEVFTHLQQFLATKDGCRAFLKRLLSSGRGCYGFNPYIGNEGLELKKEAERLWGILVASPPPYVLLPKARFLLTPKNKRMLGNDVIDDSVGVTLGRRAAALHNIQLPEESNRWEGTFGDLQSSMSDAQKAWTPLIAFLIRKVLHHKQIQKAYVLYPDYKGQAFHIPVANLLYVYPSGDMQLEVIYFPVETAFETQNLTQRDRLFHLIILCIQTQWRLLDRYREEVENLAAKERSELVELTDADRQQRVDLNKRILIDLMKIHNESQARGIINPEKILGMFPEPERDSVKVDFKTWIEVFKNIESGENDVEAIELEQSLGKAQEIVERSLKKYARILASSDNW